MATKRKTPSLNGNASKKAKVSSSPSSSSSSSAKAKAAATTTSNVSPASINQPHPLYKDAEEHGIVLRQYYPHEMSNARAAAYNANTLPRPIEQLHDAQHATAAARKALPVRGAVVHWFKMDLRVRDNSSLSLAAAKAREAGVPLIALYIVSPQDWEAHLTAAIRVDFMLRTVKVLQADLDKLDIPLHVEVVERRKEVPGRIAQLLKEWDASHLFANMEYEVDELRREAKMMKELMEGDNNSCRQPVAYEVVHDTCVVPPGRLHTGAGKQYAVYSPWFRSWIAHAHENLELLEECDMPARNPESARKRFGKLFGSPIPEAPKSKSLKTEDAEKYAALWPAGEHEAYKRLGKFVKEKIESYGSTRNFPAHNNTSSLSVHLASGTISARACIRAARDRNSTKKLDGGSQEIKTWISEVAWRDFYKHVLVNWPYVCMNKPFKPEYSNIKWSYDREQFAAWTQGRTGFPIVDAAMRQVQHMGYMHNRCRMIAASFLAKDLLIDWRMGERFFMENLIDGDFASNNGGWGFAASVGVDPQPYFRVFNPLLQSEKFDAEGDYIRKWIPELREITGEAIHDPYNRGAAAIASKGGYPKPIVEHKNCRERALAEYKKGISTPM
ncbi:DNA photolyase, FAD-binding/Cryptochrome [Coniella lustricola]|uniref:DNA photolyase, FAD-binding/Cryptochrome n=1 Tax=Coniella lustricola TaxID=2025994 RepID=A0A2T3AG98_9PEZI|nr:DNA photolyase, FAD-binding/Cryptochrome [Coniella lustricola]